MQQINFQALEIFRTVATEGSISRAAEKLGRVQSNISTRIRQLEDSIGKSLFLRKSRGLDLTADGKMLLAYAERFHQLSEETSNAVFASNPSGQFRLGAMESTAAARLPSLLADYHQAFPHVEVELTTGTAGHLLQRLAKFEIEAAFVAEPVTDTDLESQAVFEEQLMLVAPGTWPALEEGLDLNGRTLIAFEVGCAYRRYLERWLMEEKITPGATHSVSSYLAILSCVSAGTGFSVVPRSVLQRVSLDGEIRTYRLKGEYSRIRTMLVWRKGFSSSRLDGLKSLLSSS